MTALEPAARNCMDRTRSAILNVLIVIGVGIAISGLILRWRDQTVALPGSEGTRRALLAGLIGLVVASYTVRRIGAERSALQDPAQRGRRFFRAHVLAAAVGSLAVPLGLAYGWIIRPRLDAVAPFWVAALGLGFSALPRDLELAGFDEPMLDPCEPKP